MINYRAMNRHIVSKTCFVLPVPTGGCTRRITRGSVAHNASSTIPESEWKTLTVPDHYLRLSLTLKSGQSFMWREIGTFPFRPSQTGIAREWAGPIGNMLFILRQADPMPPNSADDPVWYRVHCESKQTDANVSHQLLSDYFRTDVDHTRMMQSFCKADAVFNRIFPYYSGLRTLRVHPEECLFSFICSSNNNIKRITTLVTHLARTYGEELGTHGGHSFHAFPCTETLAAEANEQDLRDAGFGYRAKFIPATARELSKQAAENDMCARQLLLSWRELGRKEVSDKLVRFSGIGRKVAGCIALMSLNQHGEIPVDTHVWQISKRYMPELEGKSLTDRVYDRIGEFFRTRFGTEVAGLAHNVLFIAELADFRSLAGTSGGSRNVKAENGVLKTDGVRKVKGVAKKKGGKKATIGSRNRGQEGVHKTAKHRARRGAAHEAGSALRRADERDT